MLSFFRTLEALYENNTLKSLQAIDLRTSSKILFDAGILVSVENLAKYTNMSTKTIEDVIEWSGKQKSRDKYVFHIGSQGQSRGDYYELLAGILYIYRNKIPGAQQVANITGFSTEKVRELAVKNEPEIKNVFANFKLYWVAESSDTTRQKAARQSPAEKKELIRTAIQDIAGGRLGSVTAAQLEKWNNGAIGLSSRAIDMYLSDDPSMSDLDKYRASGKRIGTTDKDRQAAFDRDWRKA